MPNVFDELMALLQSNRLLHQREHEGQGVRVAIIDSGIDRSALANRHGIRCLEIPGVVFRKDTPEPAPDQGRLSAPHGTTVADVVLTLAPRVELISVDVFGPEADCNAETIAAAIHYVVDRGDSPIINLSLGIPENRLQTVQRRAALRAAIENAYFHGVSVFAAAHNDHPFVKSYPAVFSPPLMSVDKGSFNRPTEFAYRLRDQIEFQAFGLGYIGPFCKEPATSWATPHLAAAAARLLSMKPDLKPFEIKTLLYWLSTTDRSSPA